MMSKLWLSPFILWTMYREWVTRKVNRKFKGAKIPITTVGRWKRAPKLPSYRHEFGAAEAGNKIFVVGGITAPTPYLVTRRTEVYDIDKRKWFRVANHPVIIHHPGVTSDGKRIYVIGGNSLGLSSYNLAHVFDPKENKWERLPDMPTKRCALGLTYWKGKIYAVGGANNKKPLTSFEEFDTEKRVWKKLPDMPTEREHLFAVAAKGKIFALGGYKNDHFHYVNTCEAYDIETKKWKKMAPLPAKVSGFTATVWKESIFVFGGEQGWSTSGEVYEYLLDKNQWLRHLDLPVARHASVCVAAKDGIHIIGGNTRMFTHHFSSDHDIFTF